MQNNNPGKKPIHTSASKAKSNDATVEHMRVAVRVRPLIEHEREEDKSIIVSMRPSEGSVVITPPPREFHHPNDTGYSTTGTYFGGSIYDKESSSTLQFYFDHTFWSIDAVPDEDGRDAITQAEIFDVVGAPLVEHAFRGFNNCLFAYGQTGSGKTYSMMGGVVEDTDTRSIAHRSVRMSRCGSEQPATSPNALPGGGFVLDDEYAGVTPRLLSRLFAQKAQLEATTQSQWKVSVGYIEVYNERVFDLLVGDRPGHRTITAQRIPYQSPRFTVRSPRYDQHEQRQQEYHSLREVREDPKRGVYVQGQSIRAAESEAAVLELLNEGNTRRSVAVTRIHDRSSRSHTIFQITLTEERKLVVGKHPSRTTTIAGMSARINLVDLAGSERVEVSGVQGAMLTQAKYINLSLTTLGRVIDALAEITQRNSSRIVPPYRESKLTYLLRESLGGNSKTMMLATISPSGRCINETLNTLRYASRAREIRNVTRSNEDATAKRIRELEEETARLRELLALNVNPNDDAYVEQMAGRIHELEMEVSRRGQEHFTSTLEEERSELERQILGAHEEERAALQVDRDKLLEVLNQARGEYSELETEHKALQNEKAEESERFRTQLEEQSEKMKQLDKLLSSGQLQLEVALKKLADEREAKEELMAEVAGRMSSLDNALLTKTETESEGDMLREELDALNVELEDLKRDVELDEQRRIELQHLRETLDAMMEDAEAKEMTVRLFAERESRMTVERDRAEDIYDMHCGFMRRLTKEYQCAVGAKDAVLNWFWEAIRMSSGELDNVEEVLGLPVMKEAGSLETTPWEGELPESLSRGEERLDIFLPGRTKRVREAVIAMQEREHQSAEEYDREIEMLQLQLDMQETELTKRQTELDDLIEVITSHESELAVKEGKVISRGLDIGAKNDELEALRNELGVKDDEQYDLNEQLAKLSEILSNKNDELAAKEDEATARGLDLNAKDNEIEELKHQLESLQKELSAVVDAFSEKNDELDAMRGEMVSLEEDLHSKENEPLANAETLSAHEHALAKNHDDLAGKEEEVSARGLDLDAKYDELDALKRELLIKYNELSVREDEIAVRNRQIDDLEHDLQAVPNEPLSPYAALTFAGTEDQHSELVQALEADPTSRSAWQDLSNALLPGEQVVVNGCLIDSERAAHAFLGNFPVPHTLEVQILSVDCTMMHTPMAGTCRLVVRAQNFAEVLRRAPLQLVRKLERDCISIIGLNMEINQERIQITGVRGDNLIAELCSTFAFDAEMLIGARLPGLELLYKGVTGQARPLTIAQAIPHSPNGINCSVSVGERSFDMTEDVEWERGKVIVLAPEGEDAFIVIRKDGEVQFANFPLTGLVRMSWNRLNLLLNNGARIDLEIKPSFGLEEESSAIDSESASVAHDLEAGSSTLDSWEVDALQDEVDSLREELFEKDAELDELKGEMSYLLGEVGEPPKNEREIDALKRELDDMKSQHAEMIETLRLLSGDVREIPLLRRQIEILVDEVRAKDREIEELKRLLSLYGVYPQFSHPSDTLNDECQDKVQDTQAQSIDQDVSESPVSPSSESAGITPLIEEEVSAVNNDRSITSTDRSHLIPRVDTGEPSDTILRVITRKSSDPSADKRFSSGSVESSSWREMEDVAREKSNEDGTQQPPITPLLVRARSRASSHWLLAPQPQHTVCLEEEEEPKCLITQHIIRIKSRHCSSFIKADDLLKPSTPQRNA